MPESLELVAGGQSNGNMLTFWIEEATTFLLPGLSQKGNLYLVAEGSGTETSLAIKSVRDAYYGDISAIGEVEVAQHLRGSLEATNEILRRRGALGVSCVCAIVYDGNKLLVQHAGDCHAYLYSSQEGTLEDLTEESHLTPMLGMSAILAVKQKQRYLKGGQSLLLCSSTVVEALEESEILAELSLALEADKPQSVAGRLVQKASQKGEAGIATAVVIACRSQEGTAPVSSQTQGPEATTAQVPPSAKPPEGDLDTGGRPVQPRGNPPSRKLGLMFLGLIVIGSLFGLYWWRDQLPFSLLTSPTPEARSTEPAPSPTTMLIMPTPALDILRTPIAEITPRPQITPLATPTTSPEPSPLSATEVKWKRINTLWPEGDEGNVAALQEIVRLLEQLQVELPGDPQVGEKLPVARINLAYRQRMQEVAFHWGTGDTSAATVASWSRVVEILEALRAQPLPSAYQESIKDKLYVAHLNYGKALEAAGRVYEAQGQYQRAIEIDPSRPEAKQALQRLR